MKQRSHPLIILRASSLFICCVLSLSVASFASDRIQVTLKDRTIVDQDVVRLADLAHVSGVPEKIALPLGEAVVANSPLPGQTRYLSLDYVRIRLKQAGFQTEAMDFTGPQDVAISRKAAAVDAEAIARAVEHTIRAQMPWKMEVVVVRNIRFDDDLKLPTGTLTHRIIPNRNEDYLGRTMLALHLFVDGELVKKTWVHADISVMADIVKVVRPLGKNQRIEREDLSVVRADLSGFSSDIVRSLDEALGNRTTQMIYPDTVLKTGMFSLPPLVKRGDIVKIVANKGPMTLTATGKVKQKGCKGEMVHVVNLDSNRVISARVVGPGAVEVEF